MVKNVFAKCPGIFPQCSSLYDYEWTNAIVRHAFSPVLTVPSVQAGIHSSVDFCHINTLPSLPLIFIVDSPVNATFFQYVIVLFTICLAHSRSILFLLFFLLINDFSRACLPLNPDDFSLRLVVLSLTVLLILALHFFCQSFRR